MCCLWAIASWLAHATFGINGFLEWPVGTEVQLQENGDGSTSNCQFQIDLACKVSGTLWSCQWWCCGLRIRCSSLVRCCTQTQLMLWFFPTPFNTLGRTGSRNLGINPQTVRMHALHQFRDCWTQFKWTGLARPSSRCIAHPWSSGYALMIYHCGLSPTTHQHDSINDNSCAQWYMRWDASEFAHVKLYSTARSHRRTA